MYIHRRKDGRGTRKKGWEREGGREGERKTERTHIICLHSCAHIHTHTKKSLFSVINIHIDRYTHSRTHTHAYLLHI